MVPIEYRFCLSTVPGSAKIFMLSELGCARCWCCWGRIARIGASLLFGLLLLLFSVVEERMEVRAEGEGERKGSS